MQHRPRLWLSLLGLLFVLGFEIGFQPIRFLRTQSTQGQAALEYDLGERAGATAEALKARLPEIRRQLEEGGLKAIEDVQFVDERHLRVTTTVISDAQRTTDMSLTLSALQKDFKGVKVVETAQPTPSEAGLVTRLGPIGIFRPAPHLRLGLDLQGGAHVVLQCQPSTEILFRTPDDRPFYTRETAAEQEQPGAGAETAASPTKSEGSTEQPKQSSPGAKETAAPKAETPAGSEGAKAEAKSGNEAPAEWNPPLTRDQLLEGVDKLLKSNGVESFEVRAPSPYRLVVRSQSTTQEEVNGQRDLVLQWLETQYKGVKIDVPDVEVRKGDATQAKHIIDLRLYSMSDVKEPIVQTQGDDRIIVELPGVKEQERVTNILKSTAQLEFRLVPPLGEGSRYTPTNAENDDYTVWTDAQTGQTVTESRVLSESDIRFAGDDLKPNAQVVPGDVPNTFEVRFEIRESRKREFAEFTRENVGHIMSIVLDGETQMAPVIRSEIPGTGVISGNMDAQEAGDLKLLLNAGALPVPLEIVENRQISATLGENAIRQSATAGIVGFIVVALFMIAYYRVPGVLADIALCLYLLIVIAVMAASQSIRGIGGVTLTLPGIAGIILTIGMAVDANVLIFERIREELRKGVRLQESGSLKPSVAVATAINAGYDKAFITILDANITTLITAGVLYVLGTGAIRGFAVTLAIGILASMFTAILVTRAIFDFRVRRRHLTKLSI